MEQFKSQYNTMKATIDKIAADEVELLGEDVKEQTKAVQLDIKEAWPKLEEACQALACCTLAGQCLKSERPESEWPKLCDKIIKSYIKGVLGYDMQQLPRALLQRVLQSSSDTKNACLASASSSPTAKKMWKGTKPSPKASPAKRPRRRMSTKTPDTTAPQDS